MFSVDPAAAEAEQGVAACKQAGRLADVRESVDLRTRGSTGAGARRRSQTIQRSWRTGDTEGRRLVLQRRAHRQA